MSKTAGLMIVTCFLAVPSALTADEGAASRATADAVREAGVAMWYWLADQLPEGEPTGEQAARAAQAVTANPASWEHCSSSTITAAELTQLVVPKYIAELPTRDGWGHELQFCLTFDESDPSRYLLAVRSPGGDGVFSESGYEVGPFPLASTHEDVVWIQGYYVRWASSKVEG